MNLIKEGEKGALDGTGAEGAPGRGLGRRVWGILVLGDAGRGRGGGAQGPCWGRGWGLLVEATGGGREAVETLGRSLSTPASSACTQASAAHRGRLSGLTIS